jgi:ribosomal protein S18 acetylase RimI-like enzyme
LSATIRLAGPGDAVALADTMRRLFVASYGHSADAANVEQYVTTHYRPELQAAEIADPGLATLIVEDAGEWAGYAQLRYASPPPAVITAERPGELKRIYFDARWHGRGVAPALVAEIKRRARERGADALWLYVWQQAPRAIAFYEKSGFRVCGTSVFMVGTHATDDWVMWCPLD